MPDAFELPGVLRAIIPLMRAGNAVVNKFVAFAFGHAVGASQFFGAAPRRVPGFTAVIGALNDLAKPAAGLRGVNSVRSHGRPSLLIRRGSRKMRRGAHPACPGRDCDDSEPPLPCDK